METISNADLNLACNIFNQGRNLSDLGGMEKDLFFENIMNVHQMWLQLPEKTTFHDLLIKMRDSINEGKELAQEKAKLVARGEYLKLTEEESLMDGKDLLESLTKRLAIKERRTRWGEIVPKATSVLEFAMDSAKECKKGVMFFNRSLPDRGSDDLLREMLKPVQSIRDVYSGYRRVNILTSELMEELSAFVAKYKLDSDIEAINLSKYRFIVPYQKSNGLIPLAFVDNKTRFPSTFPMLDLDTNEVLWTTDKDRMPYIFKGHSNLFIIGQAMEMLADTPMYYCVAENNDLWKNINTYVPREHESHEQMFDGGYPRVNFLARFCGYATISLGPGTGLKYDFIPNSRLMFRVYNVYVTKDEEIKILKTMGFKIIEMLNLCAGTTSEDARKSALAVCDDVLISATINFLCRGRDAFLVDISKDNGKLEFDWLSNKDMLTPSLVKVMTIEKISASETEWRQLALVGDKWLSIYDAMYQTQVAAAKVHSKWLSKCKIVVKTSGQRYRYNDLKEHKQSSLLEGLITYCSRDFSHCAFLAILRGIRVGAFIQELEVNTKLN